MRAGTEPGPYWLRMERGNEETTAEAPRLGEYNYSTPVFKSMTICTYLSASLFGRLENDSIVLSDMNTIRPAITANYGSVVIMSM